jgi:hypothetical protein
VYPKKGKYSKSDLTRREYKEAVEIYANEFKSQVLLKHDPQNDFSLSAD